VGETDVLGGSPASSSGGFVACRTSPAVGDTSFLACFLMSISLKQCVVDHYWKRKLRTRDSHGFPVRATETTSEEDVDVDVPGWPYWGIGQLKLLPEMQSSDQRELGSF
jgi:hypothetical protein